ncbi:ribosome silencing factor [Galactobacter valiniphilus]|uniref:Ribosomal silencing factor RsfS n=1 Tax=Galactobacter valiniphilus TaxID=2676122 RepID=A0A399J6Y5_9MICC|nr:ribosome silencing factor [Galactobacter valiniphilus]RII41228.1 ribosome silencing factor [Galactobacter valiniphilus]
MSVPTIVAERVLSAAKAAQDKLAEHVLALEVGERLGIADVFLILSGGSERQVEAIAEAVEDALREEHNELPLRREGRGSGHWVLLDYGDFVVHVQHPEDRSFYALDRLWSSSPRLELPGIEQSEAPAELPETENGAQPA